LIMSMIKEYDKLLQENEELVEACKACLYLFETMGYKQGEGDLMDTLKERINQSEGRQ